MKKIYLMIILSFLIISSLVFISCGDCYIAGADCTYFTHCSSNAECKDEKYFKYCVNGKCMEDPCKENNVFCGAGGTCTPGDNPETEDKTEFYYCKCDEGSLPYDYYQEGGYPLICTPKCKIHDDCNEAYVNLGHQIAGYCIKGQCQERNYCEQNSDCPDGEICYRDGCYIKPSGD